MVCLNCGKEVKQRYANRGSAKKWCSPSCKNQGKGYTSGYQENGVSRSSVGAISELVVGTDMMMKGYSVFRAMSPASNFDLVAFKNGDISTIEVRTGRIHNECLTYKRKKEDQAGTYAVVVYKPEIKIFYFPELK